MDETDIWVDVARQVKVVRAFKHNVIQQAEERRRSMNLVRLSQREDDGTIKEFGNDSLSFNFVVLQRMKNAIMEMMVGRPILENQDFNRKTAQLSSSSVSLTFYTHR